MEILTGIKTFLSVHPSIKEVLIAVFASFFGAFFGGISSIISNNRAMRKQCRFDMQYQILKDEFDNISLLYKKVEKLEITLSFGDGSTEALSNEMDDINLSFLKLNERLREKRKFVRKYLNAVIVEKSAKFVADYLSIAYTHGENGLLDWTLIQKVDADGIQKLRVLEHDIQILCNDMSEAMESLIEPGIMAKAKRRLRKIGMFFEEAKAIYIVDRSSKKRK